MSGFGLIGRKLFTKFPTELSFDAGGDSVGPGLLVARFSRYGGLWSRRRSLQAHSAIGAYGFSAANPGFTHR